jgi:hypothetical protein
MELEKAQEHLAEIHRHLARTEIYRGYRAPFVAASGGVALLGAWLQPAAPSGEPFRKFVLYWSALAAINVALVAVSLTLDYLRGSTMDRRKTWSAIGQLLPGLGAGFLLTWAVYFRSPELIPYLPGFWTILFSLGVFASTPYLPSWIPFVASFYLAAGFVLISLAPKGSSLNPWGMGLTFGIGQFLGAIILRLQIERYGHGPNEK